MFKIRKSNIIIITAAMLIAIIGGGTIPYLIFYTIAGVFIISYFWGRKIINKVYIYQRAENRDYYVGDTIEITSYVDNDTFYPVPYIEIRDNSRKQIEGEASKPTIMSLMPTEREVINSKVFARYRGIYDLGPVEVSVSDVFGAYNWRRKIYSDTYIKVFPKVYNIERFNLKSMQAFGTVTTKQRAYEDNISISDIRKYFPGDSYKKIHWKVSAKKGTIHVKNYEMTGSASAFVFLDFKKDCFKGDNIRVLEEQAIEAAASIVSYFLKDSVSINMYVNASKLYYMKGRDVKELRNFLEILCEIKADGNSSMGYILEKRIRLIDKKASLLIITGDINEKDAMVYCSIKQMLFDIVIIYIGDNDIDLEIKSLIENNEIKIYHIKSDSDIKGVLESK